MELQKKKDERRKALLKKKNEQRNFDVNNQHDRLVSSRPITPIIQVDATNTLMPTHVDDDDDDDDEEEIDFGDIDIIAQSGKTNRNNSKQVNTGGYKKTRRKQKKSMKRKDNRRKKTINKRKRTSRRR